MKCKRLIALIWMFSFSLSLILITKAHLKTGPKSNCTVHGLHDLLFTILADGAIFLIPVIFLIFVNTKVWFVARRHKKRIQTFFDDSVRLGISSVNDVTTSRPGTGTSLNDVRFPGQESGRSSSPNSNDIVMSSRTGTSMGLDNLSQSSLGPNFTLSDVTIPSEGAGSSQEWQDRNKWSLTRTIKQEIRTFRTFLIVIGALIISWCPFFVFLVLDSFQKLNSFIFYLTIVLGYMNSAMNVFIYGIFSKEFRRAMKKTLLVCKSK